MTAAPTTADYPARLTIDYPDRDLSRLSTLLRLFYIIPIYLVMASIAGIQMVGPFLMILFRRKYPRWWFDWNLELTRFSTRISAYGLLLDDRYPSTDEEQAVHLELDYPDADRELNQLLPLVKWILALPHFLVLYVLSIVLLLCVFVAWLAIVITGHYPRGLFNFVVGILRWNLRVNAYAFLLITDRYPPFSLK